MTFAFVVVLFGWHERAEAEGKAASSSDEPDGYSCGRNATVVPPRCVCPPGYVHGIQRDKKKDMDIAVCVPVRRNKTRRPPQLVLPADGALEVAITAEFIVIIPEWASGILFTVCIDSLCKAPPLHQRQVRAKPGEVKFTCENLPYAKDVYWRVQGIAEGIPRGPVSMRSFTTIQESERPSNGSDAAMLDSSISGQEDEHKDSFGQESELPSQSPDRTMAAPSPAEEESGRPPGSSSIPDILKKVDQEARDDKQASGSDVIADQPLSKKQTEKGILGYLAESRSSRPYWFNAKIGVLLLDGKMRDYSIPDDDLPNNNGSDILKVAGFEVGGSRTWRRVAISSRAEIMPVGGVYRAGGSLYLGFGHWSDYMGLCSTCSPVTQFYPSKHVRSVVGVRLDGDYAQSPYGKTALLGIGLGIHGQVAFSGSLLFDVVSESFGVKAELSLQLEYINFRTEFLISSAMEVIPSMATIGVGYSPSTW